MTTLSAAEVTGSNDAEFAAAQRVMSDAAAHDGSSAISDQAMLAVSQGQRAMVLFSATASDTANAASPNSDAASQAAAVGVLGDGELDLVVAPAARGRGVGTAALRELLAGRNADDGKLLAWAHGDNPAAERLLQGAGFTPVRTLLRMTLDPALLPSDGRSPADIPLPDGYALRAFDPASPTDVDDWVRVNAAAFHDHPEQGRMTAADFNLLTEEAWFDAADLFLLSGPESPTPLAGSAWVKTLAGSGDAPAETELYAVGLHPDHAGRGLGKALLAVALARMVEHSPSRVTLYVDGENERAVGLYLAAGFTVEQRSRQWQLG